MWPAGPRRVVQRIYRDGDLVESNRASGRVTDFMQGKRIKFVGRQGAIFCLRFSKGSNPVGGNFFRKPTFPDPQKISPRPNRLHRSVKTVGALSTASVNGDSSPAASPSTESGCKRTAGRVGRRESRVSSPGSPRRGTAWGSTSARRPPARTRPAAAPRRRPARAPPTRRRPRAARARKARATRR